MPVASEIMMKWITTWLRVRKLETKKIAVAMLGLANDPTQNGGIRGKRVIIRKPNDF